VLLSLELDLKVDTFFHARCTDLYSWSIRDTSPLKVRVYATVPTRVELCSTNRVRVLSNYF
jgi:hypothetical protein